MSRLAILLIEYNRIVPPHTVTTVINLRGGQLTGDFAITDPSTVPHLLTKPKPVLMTLNLLKRNNDLTVTQRSPLKQRLNKFTDLKLRKLVILILQQIQTLPLKLTLKLLDRDTVQTSLQSIQRPYKFIELFISQRIKIKLLYIHNLKF